MKALVDFAKLIIHRKWFSPASIQRYQLKQLQKMVNHAKKYSPYYQETLKDCSLNSLDDLKSFPIINKSIMMEHFNDVNTVGLDKDDVMAFALEKEANHDYLGYYKDHFVIGLSSGTSGNKGLYITPKALTKKLPFVFLARSGLPLDLLPYRILFMLRVFSQGFNDINSPLIKLNYLSTMTDVKEVINHLNQNRINILMAPPSMCRLLLPYTHLIDHPLEMIVTYAEVLEREEKQRLQDFFKCRVIEIYQASEGQFASACSHGNLHINEDLVYVELLDEHGVTITQPHIVAHHMIATNLVNTAQPLIRYEMNDLIVLDDPCPCKSHFRTVRNVIGRHDDVLHFTTHEGKLQHIFPDLLSRWIITTSENIREYQVIQHSDESCTLIIEPYLDRDTTTLKDMLMSKIAKECEVFNVTPQFTILFQHIELPQDKAKYKRFIVEQNQ